MNLYLNRRLKKPCDGTLRTQLPVSEHLIGMPTSEIIIDPVIPMEIRRSPNDYIN
ncbi:hypothetical protein MK489_07080 [Myxococcota bacterium]|nr:hypothetical protein [Myxococcota bacterium]